MSVVNSFPVSLSNVLATFGTNTSFKNLNGKVMSSQPVTEAIYQVDRLEQQYTDIFEFINVPSSDNTAKLSSYKGKYYLTAHHTDKILIPNRSTVGPYNNVFWYRSGAPADMVNNTANYKNVKSFVARSKYMQIYASADLDVNVGSGSITVYWVVTNAESNVNTENTEIVKGPTITVTQSGAGTSFSINDKYFDATPGARYYLKIHITINTTSEAWIYSSYPIRIVHRLN